MKENSSFDARHNALLVAEALRHREVMGTDIDQPCHHHLNATAFLCGAVADLGAQLDAFPDEIAAAVSSKLNSSGKKLPKITIPGGFVFEGYTLKDAAQVIVWVLVAYIALTVSGFLPWSPAKKAVDHVRVIEDLVVQQSGATRNPP